MNEKFSVLKRKDVIDIGTGKSLGRVRDVVFTFPEGRVKALIVGGPFCAEPITLPFGAVERIGEDAVLINASAKDQPPRPPKSPCEPFGACEPQKKPCRPCEPPRPKRDAPHRVSGDGGYGGIPDELRGGDGF